MAREQKNLEFRDVEVKKTFDNSVLVIVESDALQKRKEVFLPKKVLRQMEGSDITADSSAGDTGTLILPEWLAKDRGIDDMAVGQDRAEDAPAELDLDDPFADLVPDNDDIPF